MKQPGIIYDRIIVSVTAQKHLERFRRGTEWFSHLYQHHANMLTTCKHMRRKHVFWQLEAAVPDEHNTHFKSQNDKNEWFHLEQSNFKPLMLIQY